jgi:HSP20 family molecular chaperone IbpA
MLAGWDRSSVRLPRTADADEIEATFAKGVRTIAMPKAETAMPRTIEVKGS